MINLRIKYVVIFILVLLLIGTIIIFYHQEKPNINEVIEQSIIEQEETTIIKEEEENTQNENIIEEEESAPEQLKEMIVDSVIHAVDFFLKKEVDIVAIGDSLTQGVGDHTNQGGYVGILDQTINHEKKIVSFENFGKAGNRTDQLLKRLDEPEISSAIKNSDIILMTIGANDIMQVAKENFTKLTYDLFATERIHYENRLDEIFVKIKNLNPNTHIYLLGIYNPFEKYFGEIKELDLIVNDWNHTSRSVTKTFEKATFIPIKDLFENTTKNLFSDDNFHPNRIGYHRMAERVLEYLTTVDEG